MKLRRLIVALSLCPLATPIIALGQAGTEPANQALDQPSESARPHITFEEYVTQVLRSNLALAIEKSNVDISKAAVTSAKVTPDWSVDVGLPTIDISNQGQPTNFSTGLNVPIELGGKRGKRVHAALADVSTAGFDYDDAVRQLRATRSRRLHCILKCPRYPSIELQESRRSSTGLWRSMNSGFGSATSARSSSCNPGSIATSSRPV